MSVQTASVADGVALLPLDLSGRPSFFSEESVTALADEIDRLEHDRSVRCIVLTGTNETASMTGAERREEVYTAEFEELLSRRQRGQNLIARLRRMPKVVVSSMGGMVAGAGLALSLVADIRIADHTFRAETASRKAALSGDHGLSWLLTRTVGAARARELMVTGRSVLAEEAERIGLVTWVAKNGTLAEETLAFARDIADGPQIAFGYMKRNLNAAETLGLAEILEFELMHHVRTAQTADHREAVQAFAEKRKPRFVNA